MKLHTLMNRYLKIPIYCSTYEAIYLKGIKIAPLPCCRPWLCWVTRSTSDQYLRPTRSTWVRRWSSCSSLAWSRRTDLWREHNSKKKNEIQFYNIQKDETHTYVGDNYAFKTIVKLTHGHWEYTLYLKIYIL